MPGVAGSLVDRMIRAARLDTKVYEEVEHDQNATGQAMTAVMISSLAAGVGAFREGGIPALVFLALAALLGWVGWAFLTYLIGAKMLPEPQTEANFGQMLRTTGFSSSPGAIRILGLIPGFGLLSATVAAVWMLVAMVIAVRQALDYSSTGRAVGVCLIGWLIQFLLLVMIEPNPFVGTAL
ncbi:MAG: YIP1 family protein [Acidobacteria bacterium]|nr:YIP1 family protein [Acidobacteriota bacterium]